MGSCSSNYISDAKLGQLLKQWAGEDKAQEESKVRRRLVPCVCPCVDAMGEDFPQQGEANRQVNKPL